MGECLCDQCAALCCRYFALPIDNPTTRKDFDNVRWYLLHENVTIFVEKSQWYLGVAARCKKLQSDNRCGIYLTRPSVCRAYSTDNCDWHGGEYSFEHMFTSCAQLEQHAKTALAEERERNRTKKARAAARGTKLKRAIPKRPRQNLQRLSEALERKVAGKASGKTINGRGNGQPLALPVLKQ